MRLRSAGSVLGVALTASAVLGGLLASGGPAGGAGGGTFTASLTGAQEVPPIVTAATASATVTLDPLETFITVKVVFTGLTTGVTAAAIQGPAAPGTNGPVVFLLSGFPATTSGTFTSAPISVTTAQVSELKAGLLYLNIHDATFPGGEIRGQLEAVPAQSPAAPAAGTAAPSTPAASFTG